MQNAVLLSVFKIFFFFKFENILWKGKIVTDEIIYPL